MPDTTSRNDSPAALVAIARAARLAGDRDLERTARQQLSERFGIDLTFRRQKPEPETGRAAL